MEYRRATSAAGQKSGDVRCVLSSRSKCEHCAFSLKAEQYLADRREVRLAALILLDHGVDIAEAALERVVLENRRRSRCVVGRVDDILCLMDGPGRGQPDRRVVIERQAPRPRNVAPDLLERAQQESAGRSEPRFGLRDLRLDDIVVAQRALGAARDLVARELDKSVQSASRKAESDPRETGGVHVAAAEGVEQARLTRLRLGFP